MKKIFFKKLEVSGEGIARETAGKKGVARFLEIIEVERGKLITASLLYLLFCLPVITIPAATAAMVRIMVYMVDDEPRFLWKDFVRAFKENFLKSTLIGWGRVLLFLVFVYSLFIYRTYVHIHPVLYIPAAIEMALILAVKMAGYFVYPMIVRTDLSVKGIIKNSFLLLFVNKNGWKGLGILLMEVVIVRMGLVIVPYSLLILPFFGIPLLSLAATMVSWPSVKKFVLREEDNV